MVAAGVVVGAIVETDCASVSIGDRTPRRSPYAEVVPGVSSIAAVPAASGVPLADGLERIAILPAGYGVEDLERVLDAFDTTILMKIGGEMKQIVAALEAKGLLNQVIEEYIDERNPISPSSSPPVISTRACSTL